jgi:hypothetical protein
VASTPWWSAVLRFNETVRMRVARFLALATFVVVCGAVAARLWFEALPSIGPFGQRLSAAPRHSARLVPASPEAAHAYALLQRARAHRDAPGGPVLPAALTPSASAAATPGRSAGSAATSGAERLLPEPQEPTRPGRLELPVPRRTPADPRRTPLHPRRSPGGPRRLPPRLRR